MGKLKALICSALLMTLSATAGWAYGPGGAASAASPAASDGIWKRDNLTVVLRIPRNSPLLSQLVLPKPEEGWFQRLLNKNRTYRFPLATEEYKPVPLAIVGGEPITVGDLYLAMAPSIDEEGKALPEGKMEPGKILERLLTARLFTLEAMEIGLNDLAEVREGVESFSRQTLREMVQQRQLDGVSADDEVAKRLYWEATTEWKIKSLYFKEESTAKEFVAGLGSEDFDALAKKFVDDKKAEGGGEGEVVRPETMRKDMVEVLKGMKEGEVSPILALPEGYAVTKLEKIQLLEKQDHNEMLKAYQRALNFAQNTALVNFSREMVKKYATVDEKLLKELDLEADFTAALQDNRPIARIEGEDPVTVADVAKKIKEKIFHGVQRAATGGKINRNIESRLNEILLNRVFLKEALAVGLDRTEEYLTKVEDYQRAILFSAFMKKALLPEVRVTAADVEAHYQEHLEEFTYPEMVRVESLAFSGVGFAETAAAKLRQGTDFIWLRNNAEGKIQDDAEGLLSFGDKLLSVRGLPPDIRKILEGSSAGDLRLYDDGKGHTYVLIVREMIPSRVQPLEEVSSTLIKEVYQQKLDRAMEEWSGKLRTAYGVEIFATDFQISR